MAEYINTANDLERAMRMAYLESGSIPAKDRIKDFRDVLSSMLTRGQIFANGMAGEGYGRLRSDQGGNTGYDNTPLQRSLAAGSAYEPLGKYGGDLSKLPDVPSIFREEAAKFFGDVLQNPDIVKLHTDYGNPIVVQQRQEAAGNDWTKHWLYGVSQNPDEINGAGSNNQHAHGTMTGVQLPKSFNPGFDGAAQDWINKYKSIDGLTTPEAVQQMVDYAATPDFSIPAAGTDGYADDVYAAAGLGPVPNRSLGDNVTSYPNTSSTAFAGNFDPAAYLAANPDVARSGSDALEHYRNYGFAEHRAIDAAGDRLAVNPFDFSGRNVSGNVGFGSLPGVTNLGMDVAQTLGPSQTASTLPPGVSPAIEQMYEAILHRPADAAGGQAWSQALNSGALSLDQIQARLLGGDEARTVAASGLAPTLGPSTTVQALDGSGQPLSAGAQQADQIYRTNLGRPAEAAVLQAYSGEANGSAALGQLAANVYGSTEANTYRGQLAPEQAAQIQAQNANLFGAPTAATIGAGNSLSPLPANFDPQAYAAANPDVVAKGIDPTLHYQIFGAHEGRVLAPPGYTPTLGPGSSVQAQGLGIPGLDQSMPSTNAATIGAGNALTPLPPGFDDAAYLLANPDVAAKHINPEEHYQLFGAREGRALAPEGYQPTLAPQMASTIGAPGLSPTIGAPSAVHGFDPAQYLQANPDVARSGMDAVTHYEKFGFGEGRAIDLAGDRLSQNFDGGAYLAQNPDVAMAGLNPLDHYLKLGGNEGRAFTTGLSPFDFSSFNAGGGLGAGPQSMSSAYGVTPTPIAPPVSNLGFSGLDASAGLGGGLGSFGSSFGITPTSFGIGSPSASSMGTSGLGASGGIGQGQGIDAIGAPQLSVVGGYLGNVRSDGTTGGKSLAQTNAEFNAATQRLFDSARAGNARQDALFQVMGPSNNIGATTTLSSFASPMRWL